MVALAVFIAAYAAGRAAAVRAQLPGQPYASYWKPDTSPNSLLDYDAASDPDAPFNLGSVPLASRFANPALQANWHAGPGEARVMSVAAFDTTSLNPSQGSDEARYYAFSHWQYLDALVFWGGSAGEGNILAPNGTIIDAAHRNGVPVYGTIFLPPTQYGGTLDRVQDLVQKAADGSFPAAGKLIEVAQRNRFDGYFVNQETQGGNTALANQMREFLRYIQDNSDLHVVWYDAMNESGSVGWQGALNTQNDGFFQDNAAGAGRASDSMFIDFRWSSSALTSSAAYAESLGRDRYDLYAGVNVEGQGWNQTGEPLGAIFPEGQPHKMSMAFYRPDWTVNYSNSVADYHNRESNFWVGGSGDPSDTTGVVGSAGWHGVAHYVPEKSPVTGGPFVTNFNLGQGFNYYVEGQNLRPGQWNNLGLQDVAPTWRWLMTSHGATKLTPSFDFSDAYYGGSSLRVAGNLNAQNDLRLYMTDLTVTADANFQLAYKTGQAGAASNMQVLLGFADDPTSLVPIPVGQTTTAGWDLRTFSLADFAGRTIAQIGLRFDGAQANYDVNIGRMAVIDGAPDVPAPATDVALQDFAAIDGANATLRLQWEHSADYSPDPSNEIYYYNVFHVLPGGEREFLGGTPNNAFFVRNLARAPAEYLAQIEVVAIGTEFGEAQAATYLFDWSAFSSTVPGDVNQDGEITEADLTAFVGGWRSDTSGLSDADKMRAGDLDFNGVTGLSDFKLLRQALNNAGVALGQDAQRLVRRLVPEPTALALAAAGLTVVAARRRRRRSRPPNPCLSASSHCRSCQRRASR